MNRLWKRSASPITAPVHRTRTSTSRRVLRVTEDAADRSRNRGDKRLLAEFGFARSGRLHCDADRQLATPPRPQKRILPCSGLRK